VTDRRTELEGQLAALRRRIDAGARSARRDPASITLVAVTKTFPATDIRHLVALGITDVGENRDQEAREKYEQCRDLDVRWHLVGQLQRNKARSVAGYADVVHSVDRPALVQALSAAVSAAGRTLVVLLQVSLDREPDAGRGGAAVEEIPGLAELVDSAPGLVLGGVMAVAPRGADPDEAFSRLSEVAVDLQAAHPSATIVSAGMSGDLEAALRHGATHLRVGTALLGGRPPPVG
jgi:pyridoxal phosphate enzyme (YggS family)